MYYKKSFLILIALSAFWSHMVHPGKGSKKEKKSSSLKKPDQATLAAYKRLMACQQVLKESIRAKSLFLQDRPTASTHTSLALCRLVSAIFENQANFLQARQEAESQRDLMFAEKNHEAFELLVAALSKCNKILLYEHNENQQHAPDASLVRGSTIPEFPNPRNRRQSVPLEMLSSGAVSEPASTEASPEEVREHSYGRVPQRVSLERARRSKTSEGLSTDTSQENPYARTPSFSSSSEENGPKNHYGRIPVLPQD